MQSPRSLVPNVEPTGDRLVFRVRSRSVANKFHTIDLETRNGLGSCDCEDFKFNKNPNCFHIECVRKFITIQVAQAEMKLNKVAA